jgi:hypothetical protein
VAYFAIEQKFNGIYPINDNFILQLIFFKKTLYSSLYVVRFRSTHKDQGTRAYPIPELESRGQSIRAAAPRAHGDAFLGRAPTAPPNPNPRRPPPERRRRLLDHHYAEPEQEPQADAARAIPQHRSYPSRPVPQACLSPRRPCRLHRGGAQAVALAEGRLGRRFPRACGAGRGASGPPGMRCTSPCRESDWLILLNPVLCE